MTTKIPRIIQNWANSIANANPVQQANFYSKDAILLATYEPILIGRNEIYDYFVDLLSKPNIKCKITQNYSIIDINDIISSGLYTFSFEDETGDIIEIPARYTFVVKRNRIIDHHSSEEPKN